MAFPSSQVALYDDMNDRTENPISKEVAEGLAEAWRKLSWATATGKIASTGYVGEGTEPLVKDFGVFWFGKEERRYVCPALRFEVAALASGTANDSLNIWLCLQGTEAKEGYKIMFQRMATAGKYQIRVFRIKGAEEIELGKKENLTPTAGEWLGAYVTEEGHIVVGYGPKGAETEQVNVADSTWRSGLVGVGSNSGSGHFQHVEFGGNEETYKTYILEPASDGKSEWEPLEGTTPIAPKLAKGVHGVSGAEPAALTEAQLKSGCQTKATAKQYIPVFEELTLKGRRERIRRVTLWANIRAGEALEEVKLFYTFAGSNFSVGVKSTAAAWYKVKTGIMGGAGAVTLAELNAAAARARATLESTKAVAGELEHKCSAMFIEVETATLSQGELEVML